MVCLGECHGGDLVHVIIAVGCKAANEAGLCLCVCEFCVTLIGSASVRGGNRIVGFVAGYPFFGIFANDRACADILSGGVFDFDDASEGDAGIRIVYLQCGLPEAGFSGDSLVRGELFVGE